MMDKTAFHNDLSLLTADYTHKLFKDRPDLSSTQRAYRNDMLFNARVDTLCAAIMQLHDKHTKTEPVPKDTDLAERLSQALLLIDKADQRAGAAERKYQDLADSILKLKTDL